VYGWGKTSSSGQQSEALQKVTLNTWTGLECNEALESAELPPNPRVICASSSHGIACQGDSGGPMISEDGKLAGVASEAESGCPPGGLNVYTKVSAYFGFIQKHITKSN